jgi:hypothetical protein
MNWSYSKLSKYEGCPASYNFKYNLKLADPAGPAAVRGTGLHSTVEAYTKGEIPDLPPTIHHREFIDGLKAKGGKAEQAVYFNDKWEITQKEGYWCVMVMDMLVDEGEVASVWDYKSGKFYDSHYDQLMLYSLGAMVKFPEAKTVYAGAIYIDQPKLVPISRAFVREQEGVLKEHYEARVDRMFADTKFHPNPTMKCKWCPYSKKKGGPCQF